MLTLFTLPTDFVSSSTAYIGTLIADLKEPLALIFGLSIAMWIINYILAKVGRKGRG